MTNSTPGSWITLAIVLAAALAVLALLYFLYADPDRSDRLGARYGRYLYPGAALFFLAGAAVEAWHRNWGHAPWSAFMALFWLLAWRRERRERESAT